MKEEKRNKGWRGVSSLACSLVLAGVMTLSLSGTGWALKDANVSDGGDADGGGGNVVVNPKDPTAKEVKLDEIKDAGALIVPVGVTTVSVRALETASGKPFEAKDKSGNLIDIVIQDGGTLSVRGDYQAKGTNFGLGGEIKLDPDFPASTGRSALGMVGTNGNGVVASKVSVFQNTQAIFGSTDQTVISRITGYIDAAGNTYRPGNTNLKWAVSGTEAPGTRIKSAMALWQPLTLDAHSTGTDYEGNPITANGGLFITKNPSSGGGSALPNVVNFGEDTLLVANVNNFGGRAGIKADALAAGKVATIDATSKLYIMNGGANQSYKILEGFSDGTTAINGWKGNNLVFDNVLFSGTGTVAGGDFTVSSNALTAGSVRGVVSEVSDGMAQGLAAYFNSNVADTDSANTGVKFISRTLSDAYLVDRGADNKAVTNVRQVVATLEGAANMAAGAGVQRVTNSISGTFNDIINAQAFKNFTYGNEPGKFGLWATPYYRFNDVSGVKAGHLSIGTETNLGGAAFGFNYNASEMLRLGLAMNVGGGKTDSKGDYGDNTLKNDFDYFGASIYGAFAQGSWSVIGDLGYTTVDNSMERQLLDRVGMGHRLTGDVDSSTMTVGLTGKYNITTSANVDFTPYLGVRYTNLVTKGYLVKDVAGNAIFDLEKGKQNIWTIPLGVTISGCFGNEVSTSGSCATPTSTSGWVFQPTLDLGVIFAAGDLDSNSRARIHNTNFVSNIETEIVDTATFSGGLGLKAFNNEGLTIGLDYNVKASGSLADHGVSGSIRYEF